MTRRDYIVLARLLGRVNRAVNDTGCKVLADRVSDASASLRSYLQADNPRFDVTRFNAAIWAVSEGREIES